jgi:nitroreductase
LKANYRPWQIQETDFPRLESVEQKLKFLTKFGLLAPSTHNTQPWIFAITSNHLTIKPNWRYRLPEADPINRNLYISLGCCAGNVLVAAAHFGLVGQIKLSREGVGIEFSAGQDTMLGRLFPSITKRYSNKLPYRNEPVKATAINQLKAAAGQEGRLVFLSDQSARDFLAKLHQQTLSGYKISFGKELSKWLRYNGTKQTDGMPAFVAGIRGLKQVLMKKMVASNPRAFQKLGSSDAALISNSPVVGAVFTKQDDEMAWLTAGMAYEYMALEAVRQNLHLAPMAAMIESPSAAAELKKVFNCKGYFPQVFFRLGYADNPPYHTPRREEG